MKLDSKLQILVDNYREEIDNLNFSFLANEDNYKITIQEKQKIIKYCQNEIHAAKLWGKIYGVMTIFFSVFCSVSIYSLFEKVIDDDLISYVISFVIFWIVNGFLIRKFWRAGKDETNYELLLKALNNVN